jgi:phage tail-like protein
MSVSDGAGNGGAGNDGAGNDGAGGAPDDTRGLPVPLATTSSALSSAIPSSTSIVVTGPTGQPSSASGRRPDWLVNQLPVGMLDDDFFYRFVSIFQEEAGTYLDGIDNLGYVVDPAVAPPSMVRFMAGWLALPAINPSLDETYQRHLVQAASKLLRWRGTQQGLKGLLELITGGTVEIADNGGVFRQGEEGIRRPEVTIRVESTGWLPEASFLEFVRDEVPANVSVALVIGEREIWSLGALEGR